MESEPKRIILWKRDNTSFYASFFLKMAKRIISLERDNILVFAYCFDLKKGSRKQNTFFVGCIFFLCKNNFSKLHLSTP